MLIFDISADYIFLRWKKTWVSLVTHLVKNPPASRRPWVFDPWVRKIPWRREWQHTPVFLSGKFHGLRSLVGYSPWGRKESDMSEQLAFSFFKVNQSSDVERRLSLSESKSLSSFIKLLCFLSSQLMFSGVTLIQHHLRNSSWWWTGKPGVLQSLGLPRVRHDWVTELNCTALMQLKSFQKLNKVKMSS